jgi:dihydroxyacetone kinase-like predicted kinase
MSRRAADGRGLLEAFRTAVQNLASHVDEVNALNVFPVPDGDTGSNMLATVRAALAEAESVDQPTADRIAQAISYGALMGARGNSGVIASQIFRGMAEGLGGKHYITGNDLAHSLTQGAATAYRAVVKPVEGTILTVIRESAAAAAECSEADGDLESVLSAAVEGAERAVAKTPSLLPILRDAGVVDAGGQGLFRLLEGTLSYMRDRAPSRAAAESVARQLVPATVPIEEAAAGAAPGPDEGFGYETMFLLHSRGAPIDVEALRGDLERMGESVLIAGDTRAVKVHVHSGRPDQVIALGLSVGSLTRITVENLDAQSDEVREKRAAEAVAAPVDRRPPVHRHETRPHVELDTYEVEAVPAAASPRSEGATVSIGSGAAIALSPAEPAAAPNPPGSNGASAQAGAVGLPMQLAIVAVAAGDGLARIFASYGVAAVVQGGQGNNPSTGELLDAVQHIAAEEVLLLPNNPNVILAARQAGELTGRRIRVVPTRNAAEGFAALLALDPEGDATANAEVMTLAGRAVQTLQVTEAIRDALVGGCRVKKGQTIVLDPDDGLLAAGNDRVKAIIDALDALEPGFELVTLYVGADGDWDESEELAARIRSGRPGVEVEVLDGGQPHYRYLISAE